jgi:mannan endo-1,4-beta-mannosidase
MKKQLLLFSLGAIALAGCTKTAMQQTNSPAAVSQSAALKTLSLSPDTLVDAGALPQTKNLYHKLKMTGLTGVLFGHQDDRIQGVNGGSWKYVPNKSDVKNLIGEYPGIVGHELSNIELHLTYNADGLLFTKVKQSIIDHYNAGGVISLRWACNNPIIPATGRKADPSTEGTITKLFDPAHPEYLATYRKYMDSLAVFLKGLKGDDGKVIPVLFRTLHEQNGAWYWWGKTHCTATEYITMWRYTVNYLKFTAGVHNLLYVYCPSSFASQTEYMATYPGSNYIDIMAADIYDKSSTHSSFVTNANAMVATIKTLAQNAHKPFGITETGLDLVPVSDWWTQTLKPIIRNKGMSFAVVWRNTRLTDSIAPGGTVYAKTWYCAYTGSTSAADFGSFHGDTVFYFLNKAAAKHYYLP